MHPGILEESSGVCTAIREFTIISASIQASSSNKDEVMADEDGSSEDEWHEVEAPEIQANKIAVEFHIEKKKSNAEKQMEKLVRQEIEREIRQYQEDCRQVSYSILFRA